VQGFESLQGRFVIGLYKDVATQFIWLPPLSLRGWRSQPKQSREGYKIAMHLSGVRNGKGRRA
jgi:hypothetical protein